MQQYQKDFINFLIESGALTFGDFTTKSGRKTPYFINTGNFNDGNKISKLGSFYADHIVASQLSNSTVIFGPAYKGIPLAVTTVSSLALNHKINIGFAFDRKEVKDHGDGGRIVGKKIVDGDKIVLVEDVITAGTTMRESLPMLRALAKIEISAVVIAVDRQEKGSSEISAVQEVEKTLQVKVLPIVNINQILNYLNSSENTSGFKLNSQLINSISEYRKEYGVI